MVHGFCANMVARTPRVYGCAPGSAGSPPAAARSADVYSGFTRRPDGSSPTSDAGEGAAAAAAAEEEEEDLRSAAARRDQVASSGTCAAAVPAEGEEEEEEEEEERARRTARKRRRLCSILANRFWTVMERHKQVSSSFTFAICLPVSKPQRHPRVKAALSPS